jgi:hypothetical protein
MGSRAYWGMVYGFRLDPAGRHGPLPGHPISCGEEQMLGYERMRKDCTCVDSPWRGGVLQ